MCIHICIKRYAKLNNMCVHVGQRCTELVSTVEGSEITSCTSNATGVGYQGDTCIITYNDDAMHQVNMLVSCAENNEWTDVSGKSTLKCDRLCENQPCERKLHLVNICEFL